MTRIAHVTDLHLGWPALPAVVEALVEATREARPDAVVVTGDLVEWADRASSWREARALLDRLPGPQVVVPGNHDLPLLNPIARLAWPYAAWRRHLGRPLEPAPLVIPGAVILALDTSRRLALDLGAVSREQRAAVRRAGAGAGAAGAAGGTSGSADPLSVVALHHGLRHLGFSRFRNSVYGARAALACFLGAGVDVVLTGHNHFPHVERLAGAARPGAAGGAGAAAGRGARGGDGVDGLGGSCALIWAQAGTACSSRFRNPAYRRCSFNVVEHHAGAREVAIEVWSCGPDERRFALERTLRLERNPRARAGGAG